jgi:polyribonucleotide nucleotidyltransferase
MNEIIPKVNPNLSKYAPLLMTINIPEDKIRAII